MKGRGPQWRGINSALNSTLQCLFIPTLLLDKQKAPNRGEGGGRGRTHSGPLRGSPFLSPALMTTDSKAEAETTHVKQGHTHRSTWQAVSASGGGPGVLTWASAAGSIAC